MTRIIFSTRISPITQMLVRVGMLTWSLLNEDDTNEINMDSTRSFVNTRCLCSVLKVESLYSSMRNYSVISYYYNKYFLRVLFDMLFQQTFLPNNTKCH